LIIIFINSIEKKRTIKNNYKLTLNQKENTININGFDITSFKDVTLFNNHKKKKIYMEKQIYLLNKQIFYLYIMDENTKSAKEHINKLFNIFYDNFELKKKMLLTRLINLEGDYNDIMEEEKSKNRKRILLKCPSIDIQESYSCKLINEYEKLISSNLQLINNLESKTTNKKKQKALSKETKKYLDASAIKTAMINIRRPLAQMKLKIAFIEDEVFVKKMDNHIKEIENILTEYLQFINSSYTEGDKKLYLSELIEKFSLKSLTVEKDNFLNLNNYYKKKIKQERLKHKKEIDIICPSTNNEEQKSCEKLDKYKKLSSKNSQLIDDLRVENISLEILESEELDNITINYQKNLLVVIILLILIVNFMIIFNSKKVSYTN
jgi:hypothetical protein